MYCSIARNFFLSTLTVGICKLTFFHEKRNSYYFFFSFCVIIEANYNYFTGVQVDFNQRVFKLKILHQFYSQTSICITKILKLNFVFQYSENLRFLLVFFFSKPNTSWNRSQNNFIFCFSFIINH